MFKAPVTQDIKKVLASHRHTYSWTAACGQEPSIPRPPNLQSISLVSFPDPYAPAVHRRHNLYVSCLLIFLKHFAPSKKFRFKCFVFSLSLSFELLTIQISPSPPESCRHCTLPLKWGWLWFPPSSITQVKGIHIILTGGMKDRNWKNQVANENMTQRMVYFQSCTDQHLFQFKYRRGRRDVYK